MNRERGDGELTGANMGLGARRQVVPRGSPPATATYRLLVRGSGEDIEFLGVQKRCSRWEGSAVSKRARQLQGSHPGVAPRPAQVPATSMQKPWSKVLMVKKVLCTFFLTVPVVQPCRSWLQTSRSWGPRPVRTLGRTLLPLCFRTCFGPGGASSGPFQRPLQCPGTLSAPQPHR